MGNLCFLRVYAWFEFQAYHPAFPKIIGIDFQNLMLSEMSANGGLHRD